MIIVPMEDQIIHTAEHPYCQDETCPCQEQATPEPRQFTYVEDGQVHEARKIDWDKIFE